MRVAVFDTHAYDRRFLDEANQAAGRHDLVFFEPRLSSQTAALAEGFDAVCVFVNDHLDAETLRALHAGGTRSVALRCAGYNNVDLAVAHQLRMRVARVPAYSPHAVAEHTVALILALNRKIHRAHQRVREGNFALDGLLGFELQGRTAGVIGTGRIGVNVARILASFGCRVLAYDVVQADELERYGVEYVDLDTLIAESNVITLHVPLMPETHHVIDADAVARMPRGAMLINTSRGGLVDTRAVIDGLKSGQVGSLGLDVYEEEEAIFFQDLSDAIIQDDVFARLLSFPNVIVTGHQAFFTETAMRNIAETTLANLDGFEDGAALETELQPA